MRAIIAFVFSVFTIALSYSIDRDTSYVLGKNYKYRNLLEMCKYHMLLDVPVERHITLKDRARAMKILEYLYSNSKHRDVNRHPIFKELSNGIERHLGRIPNIKELIIGTFLEQLNIKLYMASCMYDVLKDTYFKGYEEVFERLESEDRNRRSLRVYYSSKGFIGISNRQTEQILVVDIRSLPYHTAKILLPIEIIPASTWRTKYRINEDEQNDIIDIIISRFIDIIKGTWL